jgi:hypothetical protein
VKVGEFNEGSWEKLLDALQLQLVVPIVGPGIVTYGLDDSLLYPHLAGEVLTKILPAAKGESVASLDEAMGRIWREKGTLNYARKALSLLVKNQQFEPGSTLLSLARISPLRLFFSTAIDSLMEAALNRERFSGQQGTRILGLSGESAAVNQTGNQPKTDTADDLPANTIMDLPGPCIYHLNGSINSGQEYAVWEEDALEFLLKFREQLLNLRNLAAICQDSSFLLLGLGFERVLLRFLLHIVKQDRLSKVSESELYVIGPENEFDRAAVVAFFEPSKERIHIAATDPREFVRQLATHWEALEKGIKPAKAGSTLSPPPKPAARPARIFFSYASEDVLVASELRKNLVAAGIHLWFDREDFRGGEKWREILQKVIEAEDQCYAFLSVVSEATERTTRSFYHLERYWAADVVKEITSDRDFYIPVCISKDPIPKPKREPENLRNRHVVHCPNGVPTPQLIDKLLELQRAYSAPPSTPVTT